MARNGVSVAQKLIAGETNYLDPFSQVFPLGEIVDVRCDDDDAITLVGQLARKVLGVLFNASDVREVVGGKYAEGVVLVNVLPNLILNGVCIGEPAWAGVAWAPIVFLQLFREQSLLLHEVLDHEGLLAGD